MAWVGVVAFSFAVHGCGGDESHVPPVDVIDLENIEDLRTRFVNDAGSQRIVLLLSPT